MKPSPQIENPSSASLTVRARQWLLTLVSALFVVVASAGAVENIPWPGAELPPVDFVHGDFNGDGAADRLVLPRTSDRGAGLQLYAAANGPDYMDYRWSYDHLGLRWDVGSSRVSVGDFDGNGRDDLLVQSNGQGSHGLLLSDEYGRFAELHQSLSNGYLGQSWLAQEQMAIPGDYNGDGRDDLLLQPAGGYTQVAAITSDLAGRLAGMTQWQTDHLAVNWHRDVTRIVSGQFENPQLSGRYADSLMLVSQGADGGTTIRHVVFDAELMPTVSSEDVIAVASENIASVTTADRGSSGMREVVLRGYNGSPLAVITLSAEGSLVAQTGPAVRSSSHSQSTKSSARSSANTLSSRSSGSTRMAAPGADAIGIAQGTFNAAGGAASYSIPVEVPPGRNGLEPELSIEYNSRFSNGLMGVGWKIAGLSAIERCPGSVARDSQSLPITWSADDRLCIDGQRLMLTSGQWGEINSRYRTETDVLARITLLGNASNLGGSYFKYEARNGRIRYYGNSNDSRVEAAGRTTPLTWALTTVQDRHGNSMRYSYNEINASGEFYPTEIAYSLPDTGTLRYVRFAYTGNRYDVSKSFVAGSQRLIRKRLIQINTFVGNDIVRAYKMQYSNSAASTRSLVDFVQLCAYTGGSAAVPLGESCMPAAQFNYTEDSPNFTYHDGTFPGLNSGAAKYAANVPPADFNGDGIIDLIDLLDDGVRVWLGTTSGFNPPITHDFDGFGISGNARISDRARMDWNDDGRMDYTFPLSAVTGDVPPTPSTPTATGLEFAGEDTDGDYTIHWAPVSWPDPFNYTVLRTRISSGFTAEFPDLTATSLPQSPPSGVYVYRVQACNLADACSEPSGALNILTSNEPMCNPACRLPQADKPVAHRMATSSLAVLWFDDTNTPQIVDTGIAIDLDDTAVTYFLLDVNGDGRKDIVTRTSGSWVTHLRTPNTDALTFQTLAAQVPVSNDIAGQVIDFNGDGRFDLLLERPSEVGAMTNHRVLLSQGTSFTVIDNALTASYAASNNSSLIARPLLADINNDGLTDALTPDTSGANFVVRINRGSSYSGAVTTVPATFSPNGDPLAFAARVIDVDGDGDLDLLRPTTPAAGTNTATTGLNDAYYWEVVPYEHDHFQFSSRYSLTGTTGPGLILGSWNLMDILGDGTFDVIAVRGGQDLDNPTQHPMVVKNIHGRTDFLTDVANGLGVQTQVSYAPLTDPSIYTLTDDINPQDPVAFPAKRFSGSMPVVSAVTQSHGAALGDDAYNTTEYQYANARIDRHGRGFLGFEEVTVRQVDAGLSTRTRFHLSFPYSGKVLQSTHYVNGANVDAGEWLSHIDNTWDKKDTASLTTTREICNWEDEVPPVFICEPIVTTAVVSRLPYLMNSIVTRREPNNGYALINTVTTTSTADIFGNVLTSEVVTDDQFTKTTLDVVHQLVPNSSAWWINKLVKTTETRSVLQKQAPYPSAAGWTTVPGGVQQQSTVTKDYAYYDGSNPDPDCVGNHRAVCKLTGEKGDASLERVVHHTYDSVGNVRTITTKSGTGVTGTLAIAQRTSTTTYEPESYFWNTMTNPMGHTISAVTSPKYGHQTAITEVNGFTTQYGYDQFGRLDSVDGIRTPVQISYFSCVSVPTCPAAAVYQSHISQSGESTIQNYYDMYGRQIRYSHQGFDASEIHRNTVYDSLGRLTSMSEPYSGASNGATVYSQFDSLKRPQQVLHPNGESQSISYSGLTTQTTRTASVWSSTDTGAITTTSSANSHGQTQTVIDAKAGASYYRHDSRGNLVFTQDAQGKISTRSFDRLGRQVSLNDPDNGDFLFVIDVVGQQKEIHKLKPSGPADQNIFSYDKIGRITARWEKMGAGASQQVGEWIYDTNENPAGDGYAGDPDANYVGQVARVRGLGPRSGFTKYFAYDSVGRLARARSRLSVSGVPTDFDMQTNYDAAGRVASVIYPTGYGVQFSYNARGYVTQEADLNNKVLRQITAYSIRDRVAQQKFGALGRLTATRTYVPQSGLLATAKVDCSGAQCDALTLQHLTYQYDGFNNVVQREKQTLGAVENFTDYDRLFRLRRAEAQADGDSRILNVTYSANGNILSKDDFAATYHYDGVRNAGPHAVTSADLIAGGSLEYSYDYHGNLTGIDPIGAAPAAMQRTISYSLANKPVSIVTPTATETFSYSPEEWRWKQVQVDQGDKIRSIYYVDSLFQYVVNQGENGEQVIENKHFVGDYLVHNQVSSSDTDGDGVPDHLDNCRLISNASQLDTNDDGFGNACDPDLDDNGVINFLDVAIFGDLFLGTDPIADFNGDGNVNFLDYVLFQDLFLGPPGPGAAGGQTRSAFLLTDNLGSVDTLATEDGKVLERFGYTAFGKRTGQDWVSPAPDHNVMGLARQDSAITTAGFTGHEHLASSGFIHMNGRVYDPDLGRFMSADPIVNVLGDGQHLNPYSYLGNNPLAGTDPSGFETNGNTNVVQAIVTLIIRFFDFSSLFGGDDEPEYVAPKFSVDRVATVDISATNPMASANSTMGLDVNVETPARFLENDYSRTDDALEQAQKAQDELDRVINDRVKRMVEGKRARRAEAASKPSRSTRRATPSLRNPNSRGVEFGPDDPYFIPDAFADFINGVARAAADLHPAMSVTVNALERQGQGGNLTDLSAEEVFDIGMDALTRGYGKTIDPVLDTISSPATKGVLDNVATEAAKQIIKSPKTIYDTLDTANDITEFTEAVNQAIEDGQ